MGYLPAPVRNTYRYLSGYARLLSYAVRNMGALRIGPVRTVFNRQIYFTAVEALRATALLALLCGTLVTTQIAAIAGSNNEIVANVLAWIVVRELGPLITAIVIIARSSGAIASELALMNIHGEIQSIGFMGIPYMTYLLMPRILGVTLSVAALNIYFQAIAIGGGLFASSIFLQISYLEHLSKFFATVSPLDFLVSLTKGIIYGSVISTAACHHGISTTQSITEVPKATTRAVTYGILTIFFLDVAFAYFYFAF